MPAIKLVLRPDNPNPHGEYAVLLKYNAKGEAVHQRIATGVYVRKEFFTGPGLITDPNLGQGERAARQKVVDDMKRTMERLVDDLIAEGDPEPTGKLVKAKFAQIMGMKKADKRDAKKAAIPVHVQKVVHMTPLKSFEKFVEAGRNGDRKTNKGKKLTKRSVDNNQATLYFLRDFEKTKNYLLSWENVNYNFYNAITRYCWDDLKMFDNSCGKKVKELISWLNWCTEEKIIANKVYNKKWIKWSEEPDTFTFTPHEILVLDSFTPDQLSKAKVDVRTRNLLMLSIFTCLRVSDLLKLKRNNFQKVGDEYYLQIDTTKTVAKVRSLALPCIVNKYVRWLMNGNFEKITDVHYNRELKKLGAYYIRYMQKHSRIFEKMGWVIRDWFIPFEKTRYRQGEPVLEVVPLKKVFTSHMGRRAGTTFYLGVKRLSTIEVMKYTGHTTVTQLLTYEDIASRLIGKNYDWSAFDRDERFTIPNKVNFAV